MERSISRSVSRSVSRSSSRGGNNLRVDSYNSYFGRESASDVFRRSSRAVREEDDEEALTWAAIQKLPTWNRMRKGLLAGVEGDIKEIDIECLGPQEKKILIERLEVENEKFFLRLRNRINRVGIELPTIEVRFEHLNVDTEAYSGSRALPTIPNFTINMLEGFLSSLRLLPSKKKPLSILDDVSGIIKPGRMTLLLGPPNSGKTTLLLALSGKLDRSLNFSGKVTYNGHGMDEFVPQRASAYISQRDLHIGEMTVRETLAFSARCQGVGSTYDLFSELTRREKEANIKPDPDIDLFMKAAALQGQDASVITDVILKILGLEVCADTLVGDEMLRGISGGQRKRLTTGEMLVGQARALFMDEISNGLDSSTTYQIVKSMRNYIQILGGTAFISLLQPAPETFELFDDIVLLSDAQIVYQGPREYVLEFFEYMGFNIEVAVWVFMTYYVIGFDPNVGRLFKQYLLLLCVSQMSSGLFRFIAAAGRNEIIANTFGSFSLLIILVMGGFILSRDDIKKWWIWGYWISPIMYGQNAISVNEFLGKSWSQVLPGYTETLGMEVMNSKGFFTEAYWYWIGVGALIGYVFLFNLFYTFALAYLNPFKSSQAVLTEVENSTNETTELTDISSKKSSIEESRNGTQDKRRGMVLPFESLSISFDDIRYSVDMPQALKAQGVIEDRLELLKGVSGAFRPGVLTALMGVSGAGKTTLMDVLAGRKTGGYIDGTITISGYPKKQETFARISGYCEQNDIHSPNVTVYESLLFSAWLRLPSEVNEDARKMFIDEVMELVELTPLRDALVGLPGVSGLSTEQRKRLTIAVELVANPSIIFMDEPTTGLDARSAAIVMRTVRNTVDTGRTVVCTIHQPGIDIFEAFDELFLLKQGGEEIYVGPLGRYSCHLIEYFEAIDGISKIRDGQNPAAWMLEVSSISQEATLGVNFAELYKNSELYKRNKTMTEEISKPCPGSKELHFSTRYAQSFIKQCMVCLLKQHWSYWRNPSYTAVRLLFTTFVALMFGTIFWNLGSKSRTPQDLLNAMGSMYAAVIFLGIQNASAVQPVVDIERTVFYRERAAGMFSAMPYAFAQVVVELPYVFLQSIIYAVIVYAMIGFHWEVQKFFWYHFFMYFTLLYFTFYGMMTVAMTPNRNIAAVISTAFYAVSNLFAGFVVPKPKIPVWWSWYYWMSPVAWTLYGLVASQYGDIKEKFINEVEVDEFVSTYFGFKHSFVGVVAIVIVGFAVLFAFLFAFSIRVLNFQKR
ncbi:pleiotropic drug resistance protein 1-like isoform X2 [Telopea speciosissima]|uniref:pleiotropic drug resistance protein 1-like isoform X2 n=1 Tax=Telopea speciosissima TaxID=54955 RepID=UPI001CC6839C|nr:pleiotropic drug resistance protein 1-like isoform X2 [Telopea speciosissima]